MLIISITIHAVAITGETLCAMHNTLGERNETGIGNTAAEK